MRLLTEIICLCTVCLTHEMQAALKILLDLLTIIIKKAYLSSGLRAIISYRWRSVEYDLGICTTVASLTIKKGIFMFNTFKPCASDSLHDIVSSALIQVSRKPQS